ncbi:hypothetical protein VCR6J2_350075 [Vibrio coralliirubri]|nr:hypothetical protein VCR6J2_350075 [Vibrio coralliirubri]
MAIINDSLFFIYALGYQLYLDYCLSTTTRALTSNSNQVSTKRDP